MTDGLFLLSLGRRVFKQNVTSEHFFTAIVQKLGLCEGLRELSIKTGNTLSVSIWRGPESSNNTRDFPSAHHK